MLEKVEDSMIDIVAGPPVQISFTSSGPDSVGVYFVGNDNLAKETHAKPIEALKAILSPESRTVRQNARLNNAFVLRSSDLTYRVKVSVFANDGTDKSERPYRLSFKNLAWEAD